MQLTGLLHGAPLLKHVDFPTAEVLGSDASEGQIQDLRPWPSRCSFTAESSVPRPRSTIT
jgi:hypothetical protein